jgi:hypothetical protein
MKASSMPKRGISAMTFLIQFAIIVSLASPGVQQALAQPESLSPLANNFNITPDTSTTTQTGPGVTYNNHLDQWLVVWRDNRNGLDSGIYGRRVDKNGSLLGSTITVLDNDDTLGGPAVAFDSTQSRYLVVWYDGSTGRIQGRVLNANGSAFSSVFVIAESANCAAPDVVYSPAMDVYLVVWEENISESDSNIRGRFVGVDGTADPGGNFPIATLLNILERFPAVAVDPSDGKYLVVFHHNTTGNSNIGGQRLLNTGALSGGVLSISADSGDEAFPDVAFNPLDDGAFVSWHHMVAGETTEIKGRLVRADNSMGGQSTLSTPEGSSEYYPSLSYARIGDPYLVTWDDLDDVLGRWVNAGGIVASDIFTVTSVNQQYGPSVAFGNDRFLVTYNDHSDQSDIYGWFGNPNPSMFLPVICK